jgi:cytosine/adenosine deaminase-related metal-dependent hydrolase
MDNSSWIRRGSCFSLIALIAAPLTALATSDNGTLKVGTEFNFNICPPGSTSPDTCQRPAHIHQQD